MNKALPVVLGAVAAGGLIFVLARKSSASEACHNLQANTWYYFTYTGPSKVVREALGQCYPVVYTLDLYDVETQDWIPPVDPENDILPFGSLCRVLVQAPCKLCGFTPV